MAELNGDVLTEIIPEHLLGETVKAARYVRAPIAVGLVVASAAAGIFVGYYVAFKKLELKYKEISESEIDQMREHFRARLVAKEVKPDISDLGKQAEGLGYTAAAPEPSEKPAIAMGMRTDIPEEVRQSFEDLEPPEDEWDYGVELTAREAAAPYGKPYVIHFDERGEKEDDGYEELSLAYYEGDDVLCDDKDKVVEDQDGVVGLFNLNKFGHGSNDRNMVYIRNDTLKIDIALSRSRETYARAVHGLEHSDDQPRRRQRRRDE